MNLLNKKVDNFSPFKHKIFQVENQELTDEGNFVKFELQQEKGQIKLHIKSRLLEKDNYNLLLIRGRLILFISEKKEIAKPLYVHHLDRNAFEKSGFEKLHQYEYKLPKGDCSIKRTIWNTDKNRLEISLGKIIDHTLVKNNYKTIRRARS